MFCATGICLGVFGSGSLLKINFLDSLAVVFLSLGAFAFFKDRHIASRSLACAALFVSFAPYFFSWNDLVNQLNGLPNDTKGFFESKRDFYGQTIQACFALLLSLKTKAPMQFRVSGVGAIASFIVLANFAIIGSKLAGIELSPEFNFTKSTSTTALLSMMALNFALGLAAFQKCQYETWRFKWLPYSVAAGVVVSTVVFCSAQVQYERKTLEQATLKSAEIFRDQIHHRLEADVKSLTRMAKRMRTGIEANRSIWTMDARNFVADNSEFKAIEWIGKNRRVEWIEPLKGNEAALNIDLTFESRRRAAVEKAISQKTISVSRPIDLVQGGKGFLIYAPVYKNDEFQGMIAGVCRVDAFMHTIPTTLYKGYSVSLVDSGTSIFQTAPGHQKGIIQSARMSFQGLNWDIIAQMQSHVNPWQSPLSLLVLFVGAIVSFLTFLSLSFLEKSSFYFREEAKGRRFLEGLSDSSVTPTFVYDLIRRKITYSNRVGYESLGLSESQVLDGGLSLLKKLVHPDDWANTLHHFLDVRRLSDGEVIDFQHRIKDASGSWRWLSYRECVLERRQTGEPSKILLTSVDITKNKEAEEKLAHSKENLEKILTNAPIGMAIVSPEGKWLDVNPALCSIFGYTKEELLQIDFQTISHQGDLVADLENVRLVLDGVIDSYSMEKRYFHKSGALVWTSLRVSLIRHANGQPANFIAQIQDITARKLNDLINEEFTESLVQQSQALAESNHKLEVESRTDGLTGIANRRYFNEQLSQFLSVAKRYHLPLSVIMLDVDHFKKFNDEFGHKAGDQVLQHVGVVLREICRESDLPARYGGEEFVILCPETNSNGAMELAQRLRQKISEIDLPYQKVTASFGVASMGASPDTLVERADAALYASKEAGRNRVTVDDQKDFDRKSA